jgi:trimeric autotransporter adhesin
MRGTMISSRRAMSALIAILMGGVIAAAGPASAQTAQPAAAPPAPQSITTVAGDGMVGSGGDGGPAISAQLHHPTGMAEDLAGSLYIADSRNNKVRKVVDPSKITEDVISTIAGSGRRGFGGNGGPALQAELSDPTGLAIDGAGDVFIADTGNNQVREVLTSGLIKPVAGTSRCSRDVDNGVQAVRASLCGPTGLAMIGQQLYISDTGHNEVRVVNANGIISNFLGGNRARSGRDNGRRPDNNGEKGQTTLESPTGLAVDALRDVFVADTGNDRVLKVSPSHGVTTVASGRRNGNRGQARAQWSQAGLLQPTGLALDETDGLFIADTGGNRIWELTGSGSLMPFAGRGRAAFSGDGGPALRANLSHPTGVVADSSAVYFADTGNERVRGVFSGPPPVLPESSFPVFLLLSALAVAGGGVVWGARRRRHRVS